MKQNIHYFVPQIRHLNVIYSLFFPLKASTNVSIFIALEPLIMIMQSLSNKGLQASYISSLVSYHFPLKPSAVSFERGPVQ